MKKNWSKWVLIGCMAACGGLAAEELDLDLEFSLESELSEIAGDCGEEIAMGRAEDCPRPEDCPAREDGCGHSYGSINDKKRCSQSPIPAKGTKRRGAAKEAMDD